MKVLECFFTLVAVLCLAGVASAQSAQGQANGQGHAPEPVTIVGTPTFQDADNPARHAFQAQLCVPFGGSTCQDPDALTVPADGRAVIEFVTANCGGPGDGKMLKLGLKTTVGGTTAFHYLVPVTADIAAEQITNSSQITKIYADPGTQIQGFAQRLNAFTGGCFFSVTGYLVTP